MDIEKLWDLAGEWPDMWIGVDFDGTLATKTTWDMKSGVLPLGDPIPAMVDRVKAWRSAGLRVRILTARVAACGCTNMHGVLDDKRFANEQWLAIRRWCREHLGEALPVTAVKDMNMVELWDDRAVTVEANTGRVLTRSL